MTRSIVLRFDAQCFDCGRSLPAGTTARWFGKGRVSCCGGGYKAPAAPGVERIDPNTDERSLPPGLRNPNAPHGQPVPLSSLIPIGSTPAPRPDPLEHLRAASVATGIDAEALATGLLPPQVERLSSIAPTMLLLVRLSSGARFLVPAQHAAHVIRCVEESCVDRVRDVTRSPKQ